MAYMKATPGGGGDGGSQIGFTLLNIPDGNWNYRTMAYCHDLTVPSVTVASISGSGVNTYLTVATSLGNLSIHTQYSSGTYTITITPDYSGKMLFYFDTNAAVEYTLTSGVDIVLSITRSNLGYSYFELS